MKVYINGQGHITKNRGRRLMILKLSMKHQAIELYKVCINHDPGMTFYLFYDKVNL